MAISRHKYKQACEAYRLFPAEEQSLSKEAYKFEMWLYKQPDWIQIKAEKLYDKYSNHLSGIDLDLLVKQELLKYIQGALNFEDN